jgi:hypothetical protein
VPIRLRRLFFVLVCACAFAPTAALAQRGVNAQQAEEVRVRTAQAMELLNSGQYAAAEAEFRRLYDSLQGQRSQVLVLGYLARAVDGQGGRDQEALGLYADYLRSTDGMTDDPTIRSSREYSQQRFDALTANVAQAAVPTVMSPIGPVVVVAGAALIVVGLVLGAVTLVKHDEYVARCVGLSCPIGSEGQASEINIFAIVTDVLIFAGAAVALTGLLLMLFLRDPAPAPSAGLGCGPDGCHAFLRGSFQ